MADANGSAMFANELSKDITTKRICVETSLRDATRMIKVIVGDEKAEWIIHEKTLLASSGFARAAVAHGTEEKSSGTISLPVASPESFNVFHKYLYQERLDVANLNFDQLLAVYVLAYYVDCPTFADLVFEVIYVRIASRLSYIHKQIHHVLTNTLPDQPLHTLLLDQVSIQILQKKEKDKFDFEEAQETLDPVTGDLLVALVKTINAPDMYTFYGSELVGSQGIPIENYSKHVIRHASPNDVQHGGQIAKPFESAAKFKAVESPGSRIGRKAIERVMRRSGTTKEKATKAMKDHDYDTKKAVSNLLAGSPSKSQNRPAMFDTHAVSAEALIFTAGNTTPSTPAQGLNLRSSSFTSDQMTFPALYSHYRRPPSPTAPTPRASQPRDPRIGASISRRVLPEPFHPDPPGRLRHLGEPSETDSTLQSQSKTKMAPPVPKKRRLLHDLEVSLIGSLQQRSEKTKRLTGQQ